MSDFFDKCLSIVVLPTCLAPVTKTALKNLLDLRNFSSRLRWIYIQFLLQNLRKSKINFNIS